MHKLRVVLFGLALLCGLPALSAQAFVTEFKLVPVEAAQGAALHDTVLLFLNSLSTGVTVTVDDIQVHNQTEAA
jgi:hypothetical protein